MVLRMVVNGARGPIQRNVAQCTRPEASRRQPFARVRVYDVQCWTLSWSPSSDAATAPGATSATSDDTATQEQQHAEWTHPYIEHAPPLFVTLLHVPISDRLIVGFPAPYSAVEERDVVCRFPSGELAA